jgi:putative ABC transport system permease protein
MIFAIAAVAFGIIALVLSGAFIDWVLWATREGSIQSGLGHVQIVRPGFMKGGLAEPFKYLLPSAAPELATLEGMKGVRTVAPRLSFSGLVSRNESTVSFIGEGVVPEREEKFSTVSIIIAGEDISPAEPTGVIVGRGLAANLGVNVGDTIVLLVNTSTGGINASEVRVRGLFATVNKAYDDAAIRVPMGVAQPLLRTTGVHRWIVVLDKTELTPGFLGAAGRLPEANFEVVPMVGPRGLLQEDRAAPVAADGVRAADRRRDHHPGDLQHAGDERHGAHQRDWDAHGGGHDARRDPPAVPERRRDGRDRRLRRRSGDRPRTGVAHLVDRHPDAAAAGPDAGVHRPAADQRRTGRPGRADRLRDGVAREPLPGVERIAARDRGRAAPRALSRMPAAALLRLAVRNVERHRARTALVVGAVAFGVAGLILAGGFVQDIFRQLGEALIRSQTGHLQIARKGFFEQGTRFPEKYLIAKPSEVAARAEQTVRAHAVMARLAFSGLLGNGTADLPIVGEGVEPEKEAQLASFVTMVAGRALEAQDHYSAVIGQGLAESLRLDAGSRAVLLSATTDGALNTLDLEIVGVFQSFSKDYDARAVRVPLAAAQELLGVKGANTIVVLLVETRDTLRAASALGTAVAAAGLEVKTWQELNDFYENTVKLYDRQFLVLQIIVLAMVMFGVANAVNMAVFERTGEFGTMRAVGDNARKIFSLVLVEGAVLGLVGAAIGVVAGVVLAVAISAVGIPMPPPPNSSVGYTAKIQIVPAVLGSAFLVGWIATVLASIPPAWRVSRIPIVDALRQNV